MNRGGKGSHPFWSLFPWPMRKEVALPIYILAPALHPMYWVHAWTPQTTRHSTCHSRGLQQLSLRRGPQNWPLQTPLERPSPCLGILRGFVPVAPGEGRGGCAKGQTFHRAAAAAINGGSRLSSVAFPAPLIPGHSARAAPLQDGQKSMPRRLQVRCVPQADRAREKREKFAKGKGTGAY